MLQEQTAPLAVMVGKWCKLAQRRRAHFIELYDSGRWRHYYTEEQFVAELQRLTQVVDRWSEMSGDAVAEAVETPAQS